MFKSFLQGFFKPAPAESKPTPPPATDVTGIQSAIIEALTAHIAKLEGEITSVRVPKFALDADGARYRTASSDFEVIRGLDPYGLNVDVERKPDSAFAAFLDATAVGTVFRDANATTGNAISYSYGGIATGTVGEAK